MLEGLIQSYLAAFGRGWAPRDELAYLVHRSGRDVSRLTSGVEAGIGSGHAKPATRYKRNRRKGGHPLPQAL